MSKNVETFLQKYNEQVRVLMRDSAEASWMAQTTGDPEWANKFSKLRTKLNLLLSNKEMYKETINYFKNENLTDSEKRQLFLILNGMKTQTYQSVPLT